MAHNGLRLERCGNVQRIFFRHQDDFVASPQKNEQYESVTRTYSEHLTRGKIFAWPGLGPR